MGSPQMKRLSTSLIPVLSISVYLLQSSYLNRTIDTRVIVKLCLRTTTNLVFSFIQPIFSKWIILTNNLQAESFRLSA